MENIKERLAAGESVEDLMKEMQNQVIAAARELETEQKANEKVDTTRDTMVHAIIDYVIALGVAPRDAITEEDVEELTQLFKESERELEAYGNIAKALAGMNKDKEDKKVRKVVLGKSDDEVLRNFLRSL